MTKGASLASGAHELVLVGLEHVELAVTVVVERPSLARVDVDLALREAAIRHCRLLSQQWGEAVPWTELARGFPFGTERIKLMGPQGVFKPKELKDGPLTLLSTLASSYQDEQLKGDEMLYDYAPPQREYENEGLKKIAELGRKVILLKQVKSKPGTEYMVFAPVALTGFNDVTRKVRLHLAVAAQDDAGILAPSPSPFSKAYAETLVQARLHQAHFRKMTLAAYQHRCCVCELQERSLLDAAHIVPDRLPEGVPEVRNGMAMCPTHHRAYDRSVLLVDEDYRVVVQTARLSHADSPTAQKVLLDYQGKPIRVPREPNLRPDPELLRRKIRVGGLRESERTGLVHSG